MGPRIMNKNSLIRYTHNFSHQKRRETILDLFELALNSIDPFYLIKNSVSINETLSELRILDDIIPLGDRRIWVLGLGKAAGKMAEGMEAIACESKLEGIILVPYGLETNLNLSRIECIPTTHPLPSEANLKATKKLLKVLKAIPESDVILSLVSGGGSSMLVLPKPPISIGDLRELYLLLVESGMSIHEMNVIRKEVSLVKGGKMAEMTKAPTLVLAISDVIGDDFGTIASGPFFKSLSSPIDAIKILQRHGLWEHPTSLPPSVKAVLKESLDSKSSYKPESKSTYEKNPPHYLLGSGNIACQAVKEKGAELGFNSLFLTNHLEGDARDLGKMLARIYQGIASSLSPPILMVSGGESTVTVTGKGTGGRNQELAASFLDDIMPKNLDFTFLSCGTDGIDGNSGFSGVILDQSSIKTCIKRGINISRYQEQNDTTKLFQRIGGCLIQTGPTGTNAMDIQIALIR
ncbi:MAG: glycerate kinase [Candidatus Heimdallarchaeota archaeon]